MRIQEIEIIQGKIHAFGTIKYKKCPTCGSTLTTDFKTVSCPKIIDPQQYISKHCGYSVEFAEFLSKCNNEKIVLDNSIYDDNQRQIIFKVLDDLKTSLKEYLT